MASLHGWQVCPVASNTEAGEPPAWRTLQYGQTGEGRDWAYKQRDSMMVCIPWSCPQELTETAGVLIHFIMLIWRKQSWNAFSPTCLIKIVLAVLPHILANFSQLCEGHLCNHFILSVAESRFVGLSVHTPLVLTKTQTITMTLKSGEIQRCLHEVISLLFFQCFRTCLVYEVQTSFASFFSIVTSKSSQVFALLGRLTHNQLAKLGTSFLKKTDWRIKKAGSKHEL